MGPAASATKGRPEDQSSASTAPVIARARSRLHPSRTTRPASLSGRRWAVRITATIIRWFRATKAAAAPSRPPTMADAEWLQNAPLSEAISWATMPPRL